MVVKNGKKRTEVLTFSRIHKHGLQNTNKQFKSVFWCIFLSENQQYLWLATFFFCIYRNPESFHQVLLDPKVGSK